MYKARYYKADGAEGGEQQLPDWLFDGVINEAALHQAVKVYQANQRQGTAAAKSRGEVAGGRHKPWRQKGTGRARQGTIRAPHWEGGGVAFPPQPHSWRLKLPKQVRALAHRSAYNARAEAERVVLVDALDFEAPKTRRMVELLQRVGVERKALVLTDGVKHNVYLSARNLPNVIVRPFGQESVYDVLWAATVIIETTALENALPARAHERAQASRGHEPEVRALEAQALEEAEAKRAALSEVRKARRMAQEARRAGVSAPAGSAAKKSAPAKPKVEAKAPKAEKAVPAAKAEKAAPAPEVDALDPATVALPKVGDLADFLARFDDPADIETLRARDSRKTAQSHYDARLLELTGRGTSDEEDGDA